MELKPLFKFKARQSPKNLAAYRSVLELAAPFPAGAFEEIKRIGTKVHVVDSLSAKAGFKQHAYPDGRVTAELPGMCVYESNIVYLPIRQKVPNHSVWIDCFDYKTPEDFTRQGKPVPAYMREFPKITLKRRKRGLIFHEFGHAFDYQNSIRFQGIYQRAYDADQAEIVKQEKLETTVLRYGVSPRWIKYLMTTPYGGVWPDAERGIAEALADVFGEVTAPDSSEFPLAELFPRLAWQYEQDYGIRLKAA